MSGGGEVGGVMPSEAEAFLDQVEQEKVLDAVILGTAEQGLSDQQVADLANRAIRRIIYMRVIGRIAEMVLEGKLWITGFNESDDSFTVKPSSPPG
jgi:hypothetical protein